MKLKRILAGVAATAMAVSTMAVASADDMEAFVMVADGGWCFADGAGNWDPASAGKDNFGTDAVITGDGTYTVSYNAEQAGASAAAYSFAVFNVDITNLATTMNCGKGADGYDDLKTAAEKMQFAKDAGLVIKDVSIAADGKTVYTFKDEDLLYGDIEGNGKIRIELYNTCGESADGDTTNYNAPEDWADIALDLEYSEIAVTFTVEGLDAPATDDTSADTTDKNDGDTNTSTGLAGMALAGLAVSGAAVVATKKRK